MYRPIVKIHGGKGAGAMYKHIISYFPEGYENMNYVEPFIGGGSVFLNKKRSKEEVINDVDTKLINIYKALRDEPTEFISRLKRVKYCEETFNKALIKKECPDYLSSAINEFILRRMSRGGMKGHFSWSERTRGGKPGEINAWETSLEQLKDISKTLQDTYITNDTALKIINIFNEENTLLYLDPPYLPETRTAKEVYEYEMTYEDHEELAKSLISFKGKVILSGYASKLYKKYFENKENKPWKVIKKKMSNNSSQAKTKSKRVEILWINF